MTQTTVQGLAAPPAPPTSRSVKLGRSFTVSLLTSIVLAGLSYVVLAVASTKFSRAEVFFAECAKEMLQTDNLVVPLYHGQPFFDKPILCYWLILLAFKLFGINHWAARLPSILAALGTLAVTGIGTAKLYGRPAGLLAASALASAFMFLSFASLCMSDMMLVLLDTCSLSLFLLACINRPLTNAGLWLTALCMGFGFLTKGPVAIVLPVLSFVSYLSLTRQWKIVKLQHYLICSLVVIAAALPWFTAALKMNGWGALTYFFIRENLQRFTGALYDTQKPIWFSLSSFLTGFAPWSLFLLPAMPELKHEWKEPQSNKPLLFAWLWVATVVGFFTVSKGKMDYYLLPAYPAGAFIVGVYLDRAIAAGSKFARAAVYVLAVVVGVAAVLCTNNFGHLMPGGLNSCWAVPLALASCSASMLGLAFTKRYRAAFCALFAGVMLSSLGFSTQICPWLLKQQAILSYIPAIAQAGPDTRIGVYNSLANWIDEITFQTGREPLPIKSKNQAHLFIKTKGTVLLVIPEDVFMQIPERPRRRRTVLLGRATFISQRLTPGFIFEHQADMTCGPKLLLLKNKVPTD